MCSPYYSRYEQSILESRMIIKDTLSFDYSVLNQNAKSNHHYHLFLVSQKDIIKFNFQSKAGEKVYSQTLLCVSNFKYIQHLRMVQSAFGTSFVLVQYQFILYKKNSMLNFYFIQISISLCVLDHVSDNLLETLHQINRYQNLY